MTSGGAMKVLLTMMMLLAAIARPTAAEIYMVRMVHAPLISYTGTVPGLKATAVASGIRPDVTNTEAQLYKKFLSDQQDALLVNTLGAGRYKKLYTLHYLINGFVVQATPAQAATLAAAPGVVQVEEDSKVEKFTTHSPDFLGLPTGAWSRVGGVDNAGEGIVIGVVDTGIYPSHPSFATDSDHPYDDKISTYTGICEVAPQFPEGSCNGKIIGARHFAAGAIANGAFNASVDFASPIDSFGHGSHTSATAAGNHGVNVKVKGFSYGAASGMAPRARIAVYKAIYSLGGSFSDVVAAIDQAVQDGVDILSLSLGPGMAPAGGSTFLSVFEVELLFAVRAGVFVAHAAGNSGPFSSSILSFSPWLVSVAASSTDRSYTNTLVLGNNYTVHGVGLSPPTPSAGSPFPMVSATDATVNASFFSPTECQEAGAFNRTQVKGAILLCTFSIDFFFGIASVSQVADTAKELGAIGFVLALDPELGEVGSAAEFLSSSPLVLPGLVVTDLNSSLTIFRYYNDSAKRDATARVIRIGDGRVASFGNEAPVVADFSSRGPVIANSQSQFADVLKPDITAPGSLIWSAWSPEAVDVELLGFEGENFALLSGTSMSTPHIAGVAALVKEAWPLWSPAVIASALMTSANLYDNYEKPILTQYPAYNASLLVGSGTPFDFGSGSVNATSALNPGLVFAADFDNYLSFLCAVPGADPNSVRDATGLACGSSSPFLWPSDLNKPYITIGNLVGSRTVTRTVTNVASKTETYHVSIKQQPSGVLVTVTPNSFGIKHGENVSLVFTLRATTSMMSVFSFGIVELTGSENHIVRIPVAISAFSSIS